MPRKSANNPSATKTFTQSSDEFTRAFEEAAASNDRAKKALADGKASGIVPFLEEAIDSISQNLATAKKAAAHIAQAFKKKNCQRKLKLREKEFLDTVRNCELLLENISRRFMEWDMEEEASAEEDCPVDSRHSQIEAQFVMEKLMAFAAAKKVNKDAPAPPPEPSPDSLDTHSFAGCWMVYHKALERAFSSHKKAGLLLLGTDRLNLRPEVEKCRKAITEQLAIAKRAALHMAKVFQDKYALTDITAKAAALGKTVKNCEEFLDQLQSDLSGHRSQLNPLTKGFLNYEGGPKATNYLDIPRCVPNHSDFPSKFRMHPSQRSGQLLANPTEASGEELATAGDVGSLGKTSYLSYISNFSMDFRTLKL